MRADLDAVAGRVVSLEQAKVVIEQAIALENGAEAVTTRGVHDKVG